MTAELFMDRAGVRLHYRIDGEESAPWLMLSNSLGTNLGMWEPQMSTLLQQESDLHKAAIEKLADVPA